jgi:SAM-dependent methyltransferase
MKPALFEKMAELEDKHWWFLSRQQIVFSVIQKKIKIPFPAQILDAGCGTGGNCRLLSKLGHVVGMDADETALRLAQGKGCSVVKGGFPHSVPFPENSFHLITLLDVLEHLDEDEAALHTLYSLLKPEGYLLITVPAFSFLWSSHDVANSHKRRYTLRELKEKAQKAGFKVKYMSYFNVSLFLPILFFRLLRKKSSSSLEDDLWLPPKFLNFMLKEFFGSERFFLGRFSFPFGVSLISVCEK